MASIPADIIPNIFAYLPNSFLQKIAHFPPFLVPAQQALFYEIELSSSNSCSRLASVLRNVQSSHLGSYVRRLYFSPCWGTGSLGPTWLDDANVQELLVELLRKFDRLKGLIVNYPVRSNEEYWEWENRISLCLHDAISRTLKLPSLTTFRLHRVHFQTAFALDDLFINFADKEMKEIMLDAVTFREGDDKSVILYPSSPQSVQSHVPINLDHLHLKLNYSAVVDWLLHARCPIKHSTIQKLSLMLFNESLKLKELFPKTCSLNMLELFLYQEQTYTRLFDLPLLFIPTPSMKTLKFHFSYQVQELYGIVERFESSVSTLDPDNNIEDITITFVMTNYTAPTNTIYDKELWSRLHVCLMDPNRFPNLKNFEFVLYWADIAKLNSISEDCEPESYNEPALQYVVEQAFRLHYKTSFSTSFTNVSRDRYRHRYRRSDMPRVLLSSRTHISDFMSYSLAPARPTHNTCTPRTYRSSGPPRNTE